MTDQEDPAVRLARLEERVASIERRATWVQQILVALLGILASVAGGTIIALLTKDL